MHPQKLTWNSKIKVWKMKFLSKWMIFRFHVRFRWCISHDLGHEVTNAGCWVTDTHGGLHRHIWKLNMDHCKNPTWKPSFSGEPLRYVMLVFDSGRVQSRELWYHLTSHLRNRKIMVTRAVGGDMLVSRRVTLCVVKHEASEGRVWMANL